MAERYYQPEIETASRETIEAMQSERLVATVKRVYENVPFYAEKMRAAGVTPEDIHGVEDLHKLPFSYKQDLRDTYPYGLFAVPLHDVVRLHASSGTTGKQIVVGYTRHDLEIWNDCCARALTAAGCTADDVVHIAYGYGLFTGGLGADGGATRLGATTVPVSSGNTQRQITILRDFGSTVLCCTPSYALHIAEVLHENGLTKDDIKLKAGIFGAEPWTNEMRRQIEEELGIHAYDIYGLTEIYGPGIGITCEKEQGIHYWDDYVYIEIINPETGEPVPDGETGEIVITTLVKEGAPLLRFRTHDLSRIIPEKCSCGRSYPRLDTIGGRSDDMFKVRGVNMFPKQVEELLQDVDGVLSEYNITIAHDDDHNKDIMILTVEVDGRVDFEKTALHIRELFKSRIGMTPKVTAVPVGTLQRSEKKTKRVIDYRYQ